MAKEISVGSKLFAGMRKKLEKKYEDIIIDLEEPAIWASSGNYVLNHILSGKFGRGFPSGRITQLYGESGCLTPYEKIKVYKFKSKLEKKDSDNTDIRMITDQEMIFELTQCNITNNLIDSDDSDKLRKFFLKHVQEHSEFEMIEKVYDSWKNGEIDYMVNTPDGFQYASRFIKKDSRPCYDLRAVNFHIDCSGDHLIETDKGWVKTEDIKKGDRVLTKVGFEEVQSNEQIDDSEVYDMTIEHENHRYWGGAGISSHNSGKSFLVASAISEAQKEGYMVVILDSEQAMSQDYLEKVGVNTDPDMLMTVQTYTVEQTQDLMVDILNDVKETRATMPNAKDLKLMLVVDSLGLLSSNKAASDAEKGNAAADMGTKAKALVRMFNAITQKIGITEAVCLMTNHGAHEVGVLYPSFKPTGGRSVEYVPSISLKITKGKIKEDDLEELGFLYGGEIPKHLNSLGIVSKIELYKSRFTRPFRKVQLMIPYDMGLHKHAGLFTYLYENGILKSNDRKGYYNYTLTPMEKDFTRKKFIEGGFADIIIKDLLKREEQGEFFDFIMKSSEEVEREKHERSDTITEEINDSVKG